MPILKSEKAKLELASKARVLNLRERSALLLADGRKTRIELQVFLQDDGTILQKLIAEGYLISPRAGAVGTFPIPNDLTARQVKEPQPSAPASDAPTSSVDNFEGKRSLATTRMFLFDICERMFARKLPELAHQFRDRLREARDRELMLSVAREIICQVEEIAGAQRADGLSERIAMLLPSEQ
jgi:hypothetical protein